MDSSDHDSIHPTTIDLPPSLKRQIGRVIVAWASFEWRLSQAAQVLLGVGPQTGRIAVREPRVSDRIEMLRDLLALSKVKVDFDFNEFISRARGNGDRRDWLAHGVWVSHEASGKLLLRITKGTWSRPSEDGKARKTSRRLYPQGQAITAEHLKALRKGIVSLIDDSEGLALQM